jgi:hypothetical protein
MISGLCGGDLEMKKTSLPGRGAAFCYAALSMKRDSCQRRFSPTVTPLRRSESWMKRGPLLAATMRWPVLRENPLSKHHSSNDITRSSSTMNLPERFDVSGVFALSPFGNSISFSKELPGSFKFQNFQI